MNEKVQKIGLGSAQFGLVYGISNQRGKTPKNEVSKILEIAKNKGIHVLDTASAYGDAEEVLGQHDLSGFNIVSKFMPQQQGRTISEQISNSLQNLGVTSLYGYLAHRPQDLAENMSQWTELNNLKDEGIIQKIGYSLNNVSELTDLLRKGAVPDIVQVPFNYFDRRFDNAMVTLKEKGCEIHTRSAFLQGLFFKDIRELDSHFKDVFTIIEHLQNRVENLPAALLNFVLDQPFVDYVIMGVENSSQFLQNVNSIDTYSALPTLKTGISESILIPSNWPT